jgi:hypothetical protein
MAFSNPLARELLGHSEEESRQHAGLDLDRIHLEDRHCFLQLGKGCAMENIDKAAPIPYKFFTTVL